MVDPIDGVIIATNVAPPDWPDGRVTFKLLSDYMYLVYQQSCTIARQDMKKCLDGLKWVVYAYVTDANTTRAAEAANGGSDYDAWEGTTIPMSAPHGAAMLASPIGVGVAYLCGQHKKTWMGQKIPNLVRIFKDDSGRLGLAYNLTDYEPGM